MSDHSVQQTAEQIEEDHARLKAVMAEISDGVNRTISPDEFRAWKTSFLMTLRDFQGQLMKHFDLEEDGGFIEDMQRMAPQWMNRIDGVVDDHVVIGNRLEAIIGRFKDCQSVRDLERASCREDMKALFDHLHEHEQDETELFQMAHNRVYGAGD